MKSLDPMRTEIVRSLVASVAEEMGQILRRASLSPNIRERLDFSTAVFDRQGELVAHAEHIPVHLGSMVASIRLLLPRLQRARETLIFNDPYAGGSHLPDLTLVTPVVEEGQRTPLFFVANRAHHADIGAKHQSPLPLAECLEDEGVVIAPTDFTRDGQLNRKVLEHILNNVKTFDEREVDLTAQLAANRRGAERMTELVARLGRDHLCGHLGELLQRDEEAMRSFLATFPEGDFTFADHLDDDGFGSGPVRLSVTLCASGGTLRCDFSASADQVRGPLNTVPAVVTSAVLYVLCCLAGPRRRQASSGLLRPIEILTRPGSVLNPKPPAAVGAGNMETSQRVVDILLGALHQVLPGRIPAASQGTMNNLAFAGHDARHKRYFTYYETLAGGTGALPDRPGSAAVHSHMTNTLNTPIEVLENDYPLRVLRYQRRRGSGGQGLQRGGDGLIREFEVLQELTATLLTDRRTTHPYGLEGGLEGQCGVNEQLSDGYRTRLPGKVTLTLYPGERLVLATPGGGGYGEASSKSDDRGRRVDHPASDQRGAAHQSRAGTPADRGGERRGSPSRPR
ncbi:MAG: hypothetical protein A2284_11190 [Deltaproteobacteria bacterium RIFOXYA12_FULL_61_11]|nr:MAG: hypothetical protein A2284_11190 [Deltaproteobacteria bacterium RIFOXYA12_FULL_61_11]